MRSAPAPAYTYTPVTGTKFLKIASGFASADVWQTVKQVINVSAGQLISGYAAFAWGDISPRLDAGRVRILDSLGTPIDTPWLRSGASFPNPDYPDLTSNPYINYSNGPWEQWSYRIMDAGIYTIEMGVANTVSTVNASYALFDNLKVTCP